MPDQPATSQGVHNIASPWYEAGCSVIPIRTDGTKRPVISWAGLQRERLSPAQVDNYWRYPSPLGVAVVCGAISGNLEMLELEGDVTDGDSLAKIGWECVIRGVDELWPELMTMGYVEWSPAGGLHVIYRISDHEVPGNTKLAQKKDGKTLAETRGEGGYVIVAPTSGQCHPTGEPWTTVAGRQGEIPVLTWAQRNAIHGAITAALNESPPPIIVEKRTQLAQPSGDRPGDAYNAQATWEEILEPEGWVHAGTRGQETMWVRPGKSARDGHSASTGYANDADRLYVWSTSAGLPSETPLSKFFVYTHYSHNGDFAAATRALSKLGYGAPFDPNSGGLPVDRSLATPAGRGLALPGDLPQKDRLMTMTDSGNADRVYAMNQDDFRYEPVRNKWFRWDGNAWRLDHQGIYALRAVEEMGLAMYEEYKAAGDQMGMRHAAKSLSADKMGATLKVWRGRPATLISVDDFDADPNLLNCRNGILDLTTGALSPPDPKKLLTKTFGASFDPQAACPNFEKYLEQVLPDADTRDYLQRMVGYTLTGDPVERALAILHGPGGTGKSRFIEVMSSLFRDYGTTAADSLFRSKREHGGNGPTNDLNDLRGARLASVSELDHGVRMDEALVKRLTGFDRITSRAMYEENQTWMPNCVIWLATNHHFRITSDDGAIWHRIKVIPFTQEIPWKEQDPHILKKLLLEADGILNWMLEGLRKYRERGLVAPTVVEKAVAVYKGEQDVVQQFISDAVEEDRLTTGEDHAVERNQVYAMYVEWCRAEQEHAVLGRIRFNRRMMALGFHDVKRNGRWVWKGLGIGSRGVLGSMTFAPWQNGHKEPADA